MANSNEDNQDDLLAHATAPNELTHRNINGDFEIYSDSKEQDKARFKIDHKDRNLSGGLPSMRNGSRLELDPDSFRNEVELHGAAKKRKSRFLILGVVVAVGVFAWGVSTLFPSNTLSDSLPVNSSETQKFRQLYPDAPRANVAQMSLGVEGKTVRTFVGETVGHRLVFNDDLAFSQLDNCAVTQVGSFRPCLSTTPTDPTAGTMVWLTKDAVRSSLFANAINFQEVPVAGAATAAVMGITGFAPEARAALVVVTPDSAGYIITLPVDASLDDAKALAATITVE